MIERESPPLAAGALGWTFVEPAAVEFAAVEPAAVDQNDADSPGAGKHDKARGGEEPGAEPPRTAPASRVRALAKAGSRVETGTKSDWRESIPYDETGVLIRPRGWRDDDVDTALLEVGPLRDELIRAQRGPAKAEASLSPTGVPPATRPEPGIRRRLSRLPLRRVLLTGVLLAQAGLSLRNTNTAFEDEALYLYSGHLEIAHLVSGATVPDFAAYFSGAPLLYPVVGALADQIGGLFGARLLSLSLMLATTGLLYLVAKRLFGVRPALCAALLFATTPSAIFVGGLATYDAPALFLLAVGTWIVVAGARTNRPWYLVAALPLTLAVATKYAALLFVPTVVVLAATAALPYRSRWRAALRAALLAVSFAAAAISALILAGPDYLHGIDQTTTERATGTTPISTIWQEIGRWGACVGGIALIGAALFAFWPRSEPDAPPRTRQVDRIVLSLLLFGTALLAPADQLRIHTDVSLQKHIGFGLFFAAPLAGYALVRLVGPQWARIQLGIGAVTLAFAFGVSQSTAMFTGWPNSAALIPVLRHYQKPGAAYLVEADEVAIYYLHGDPAATPSQFYGTFSFFYTAAHKQLLSGNSAYTAAIKAGYFQEIALENVTTPAVDHVIEQAIKRYGGYRLVDRIPEITSYGPVVYEVWVKT